MYNVLLYISASAVSGLVLMRNFRFIFRTVYGCTAVLVCCFGTVYCTCLLFWDSVLCTCSLFWDSVLYLCVVLGQCTVPVCCFGTVNCTCLLVWDSGLCSTVPVCCLGTVYCTCSLFLPVVSPDRVHPLWTFLVLRYRPHIWNQQP